MSDRNYTISFINGNPGFVINADTPEELDAGIMKALPIFKKFKAAVDVYREKQIQDATPPPGQTNEPPICGIHHTPMNWRTGVSKKTGKSYAFWACPTKNPDNSFCTFKAN